MKAVVMAGGEGTRLRPLTSHRPKPLAPVLNKPIMEHIILLLKKHGITEIIVTVYYLADEIEKYFGDGSDWGVKLIYSVEETPMGTAGSVRLAADHLKDDTFVIISGDALTDIDIGKALDFHKQKQSMATIVLTHVENPLEFGVVITDEENRIRRFLEKPGWGEVFSDTVNTGIYILEPSVFKYMEYGKNYDWSGDIFPQILREEKPLFGYIMPDYWCDIGNLAQYRESQYFVLDQKTQVGIPGEMRDGSWYGEDCQTLPGAIVRSPCLFGHNVKIKSGAVVGPYAVIGDNAVIEENAVVDRSILWDGVYAGAGARLEGCTVCSHVTIQRDCLIQEGAVIGDRCRIERESTIRSQIKLWPDKTIEAGSTVTMSLIWGRTWQGALFRQQGVMGIANRDISPEFATRLGASFGAYLKPGATVVTARDSGLAPRMIKRALQSSLMSVGCNVLDLRSTPLPVARHAIPDAGAAGGIYVRTNPENPRVLQIQFMDQHGVYLSKAIERKMETIFFREDFARVDAEEIGKLEFGNRSMDQYQEAWARHIDSAPIRERAFKIVADFAFGRTALLFPTLLGGLGCDVIALNAFVDKARAPKTNEQRESMLPNLAEIVRTTRADLGVFFHSGSERLTLVDETGGMIAEDRLLALFAILVARTHDRARIAIPITAPARIEQFVSLHGGTVKRTKTDIRELMSLAARREKESAPVHFAGDAAGGFIFSEFQPGFDSMFAFGKLLEMLAVSDLSVGEIQTQLPPMHIAHVEVRCPWDQKGRIMRELTVRAESEGEVDLIDGIRIRTGSSWALVIPDDSEPWFHVFAEADSETASSALLARYVSLIESLRKESEGHEPEAESQLEEAAAVA